jgi:hypothetical protein
MSDDQPTIYQEVRVPEALAAGTYANGISVWHVETDVTLDFFINLPPEMSTSEDGTVYVVPQQVVARVKLSPRMAVYAGIQIADAITRYEAQYGTIEPLKDQPPLIPPYVDGQTGGSDDNSNDTD